MKPTGTYYPDMNIIVLYVFSCSPSKKTGHIPGYRFALHLFFYLDLAIRNDF